MQSRLRRVDPRAKTWIGRLDRAARELNAFLLVLAIGLAALDFTCFFAFKMRDALPTAMRIGAAPSLATKPPVPVGQSLAALSPTKPSANVTGW